MTKLRYFIYEIVSISVGLALLSFFGILSLLPMEIHMMGNESTVYWIFLSLIFAMVSAFVLLSFLHKKFQFLLTRIFDIATLICLIFVINSFLVFTQDLFEPWMVQVAWWLRYEGGSVGLFLGFLTLRTITGLSSIISGYSEGKDTEGLNTEKGKGFTLIAMAIIVVTLSFFCLEMILFRFVSFFSNLVVIFIIGMGITIFSVLNLLNPAYYNMIIPWSGELKDNPKNSTTESAKKKPKDETKSLWRRINKKLRAAGTRPREFWVLFFPLLILLVISITTAALYNSEIYMHISIPYEVGPINYDMPLQQLFSIFILVFALGLLVFYTYQVRMRRRLIKHYGKGVKASAKMANYGNIDVLRFIGLFLVLSQVLYYFEFIIYLPTVLSYMLLFGIIGAVTYFAARQIRYLQKLLYIVAILILALNFYLVYQDGLANLVNIYSGEFDVLFPFTYLHSWTNFALVGIPFGILISDLFYNFTFKYTDGSDAPSRSLAVAITPFMLGLIFIAGNFILNNPGGDPPLTDQANFTFHLFFYALTIVLLVGLGFNYLVTEIILPRLVGKKSAGKNLLNKVKNSYEKQNNTPKGTNISKTKITQRTSRKKQVIGISIAMVVVLSFVGGFAIYYNFSRTYQRPILIYNPGNYIIWLQNSTERVARTTQICTESSPQIDSINISLAKNEYAAFQLVWRPLGEPITALTYNISDFQHSSSTYNITEGNFSLRYVDWVLEDEFPDILLPFTTISLDKHENYVFWFDIRTPYAAIEGEYQGEITFNFSEGQIERIKIGLHIWNFTIPTMRHLRTNFGGRSDDLRYINNYIAHRTNDYGVDIRYTTSYTTLNTQEQYTCYLNVSDDTWIFNWTWWDNLIQYKLDNGMNAFTLPYPLGIHVDRDPIIDDPTKMLRLKNWLTDVQTHLEANNWLNYSYFYFIDEFSIFIPAPYTRAEYFNRCKILLSEIKNASPKIKIMTTTPPSAELELVRDYIDIYCPISNDRDKERWDERLAADYEFWFYTCIGPTSPWPNAMLYDRLYSIRILLWQAWLYDIHGYLNWHAYAFYHGKYGLAFNGYGDGWFIYEMGGQLYDSIRWEQFLEGQEDYEYLWLLNATLQYLDDNPGLISAAQLANYRSEFNNIVDAVVGERWIYCDHVNTLYSGRDRVGSILNDLASVVNLTALGEAQWLPPYRPGS